MFYIALPETLGYMLVTLDEKERVVSAVFANKPVGQEIPYARIQKDVTDFVTGKSVKLCTPFVFPKQLSPFTLSVLRVIESIPYGKVMTYKEIGEKLGKPLAVRAIGSACAKNPLALFIPCHRVVRTHGEDFGYAWGKERKEILLTLEKSLHDIPSLLYTKEIS